MFLDARRYITEGNYKKFLDSAEWLNKRKEVFELDHHECVRCKAEGRHTRADRVHHVNEAKYRPDLALSIWYETGDGELKRNLISVCFECHEKYHPERLKIARHEPLTEEKW